MSRFNGLRLTKLGEKLLADVNGNLNETITFTKGEAGAGTIGTEDEIRFLTALKEKWTDLKLTSIEKTGADKTIVKLEFQFSNAELKEEKKFREIGVYAKSKNGSAILFAYTNAGEFYDYIPLPKDNPQTFIITINLTVTSSNVDAIIDTSAFVTLEALNKAKKELDDKKLDKGNVPVEYNTAEKIVKKIKELSVPGEVSLDWSDINGKPSTFPPETHNQASNTITTMNGYTKHSNGGIISPSDSLNTAIGKLEKNLENKASINHNHSQYAIATDVNSSLGNKADKNHKHNILTIRNGGTSIQYDGSSNQEIIIEAGTDTPGVHTHSTNDIVYLTGYNKHYSYKGALVTNDSLNKALAKLENALDDKASLSHSHSGYASIDHTHSGYAQTNHSHGSNNITYMTGYSKDNYGGAINTYDSLNTAIGKLEKNLENKAGASHSHSQYITSGDISGYLTNKADKNHSHSTNDVTSLAGYSKGYSGAIRASDSLNEALSKLEIGVEEAKNNSVVSISWEEITGKPSGFTPNAHYQPSNTITSMEGYYKGYSAGAISTSDSLNTAISKLEVGLGNKASVEHSHSGYALASHSHSGYASSSHNHDSSYLKLSGGTISGNLEVTGTINGSKVYNGVWNDYAELFEKGEETEAGDIVCLDILSNKEQYIKADENSKRIIGVHSDTFAHLIGGENLENFEDNFKKFIPVGLAGRVNVKVKGKVEIGDYIVPSDEKGIGRAYNKETDDRDMIIGFLVESDDKVGIRRLKMYINKK